jgi:hypothetical protein
MLRHATDDLGYRRLAWRSNPLNVPSRRAAERFGFAYEGTSREAEAAKGRLRDTAWYSLLTAGGRPGAQHSRLGWTTPTSMRKGRRAGALLNPLRPTDRALADAA